MDRILITKDFNFRVPEGAEVKIVGREIIKSRKKGIKTEEEIKWVDSPEKYFQRFVQIKSGETILEIKEEEVIGTMSKGDGNENKNDFY